MKLEQQVCSLADAKRLKALGMKQESLWYWLIDTNGDLVSVWLEKDARGPIAEGLSRFVSAFTVAELGETLKEYCGLDHQDLPRWYEGGSNDDSIWVVYVPDIDGDDFELVADTEADARAKMLVYLFENKLITP